jgi:hypothetical protein
VSWQTTFAAEVPLPQVQFLLEEQTLNKENLIYQAETQKPTVFKREGKNLEPR